MESIALLLALFHYLRFLSLRLICCIFISPGFTSRVVVVSPSSLSLLWIFFTSSTLCAVLTLDYHSHVIRFCSPTLGSSVVCISLYIPFITILDVLTLTFFSTSLSLYIPSSLAAAVPQWYERTTSCIVYTRHKWAEERWKANKKPSSALEGRKVFFRLLFHAITAAAIRTYYGISLVFVRLFSSSSVAAQFRIVQERFSFSLTDCLWSEYDVSGRISPVVIDFNCDFSAVKIILTRGSKDKGRPEQ